MPNQCWSRRYGLTSDDWNKNLWERDDEWLGKQGVYVIRFYEAQEWLDSPDNLTIKIGEGELQRRTAIWDPDCLGKGPPNDTRYTTPFKIGWESNGEPPYYCVVMNLINLDKRAREQHEHHLLWLYGEEIESHDIPFSLPFGNKHQRTIPRNHRLNITL